LWFVFSLPLLLFRAAVHRRVARVAGRLFARRTCIAYGRMFGLGFDLPDLLPKPFLSLGSVELHDPVVTHTAARQPRIHTGFPTP